MFLTIHKNEWNQDTAGVIGKVKSVLFLNITVYFHCNYGSFNHDDGEFVSLTRKNGNCIIYDAISLESVTLPLDDLTEETMQKFIEVLPDYA